MLGNIPLKKTNRKTTTNLWSQMAGGGKDHHNSNQQMAQLLQINCKQSESDPFLLEQMEKAT